MSESIIGRESARPLRLLGCYGLPSWSSASVILLSCFTFATDALSQPPLPPYQSRRIDDSAWPPASATYPLRQANGEATVDPRPKMIGSESDPAAGSLIDASVSGAYAQVDADFEYVDRLGGLVKRVARLVKPSVIHIEARKVEKKQGRSEAFDEAGAGVVVEIAGGSWILTNRHVIAGAETSEIVIRTDDGRSLRPSKVVADASTDVAVMKVEAALPLARIGRSNSIDIGDFVIAIGSPFGLSHSVTFGILSARGRRDLTLGSERIELQDFFQTDAAINPGNSGGPLLNMRGEVIAINTAIASSGGGSEGIGFAIPIDMVMRVAEELVRHGKLRRGYLGVTLDPDFQTADSLRTTGSPFGALVKDVRPGSPAHEARLQRGDVILEFDGASIENDDHLVTLAGLTMINREVPVVIYRSGQKYRTTMKIAPLN
jgi:serine protease Do